MPNPGVFIHQKYTPPSEAEFSFSLFSCGSGRNTQHHQRPCFHSLYSLVAHEKMHNTVRGRVYIHSIYLWLIKKCTTLSEAEFTFALFTCGLWKNAQHHQRPSFHSAKIHITVRGRVFSQQKYTTPSETEFSFSRNTHHHQRPSFQSLCSLVAREEIHNTIRGRVFIHSIHLWLIKKFTTLSEA